MKQLTTSGNINTQIEVKVKNNTSGSPLNFKIYLDDTCLVTDAASCKEVKTIKCASKIDISKTIHYVYVELCNNQNKFNYDFIVQAVKIDNVWFHVNNAANTFRPNETDEYIDYLRSHNNLSNFPPDTSLKLDHISTDGKLRIKFTYPLYLFGLYYNLYMLNGPEHIKV